VFSLSGARFAPGGQSGGAISANTGIGNRNKTTERIMSNDDRSINPPSLMIAGMSQDNIKANYNLTDPIS
jgi:hypothetical protein